MATHSCIFAWRFPWTEQPGRLPSTGSPKSQTRLSDSHMVVLASGSFQSFQELEEVCYEWRVEYKGQVGGQCNWKRRPEVSSQRDKNVKMTGARDGWWQSVNMIEVGEGVVRCLPGDGGRWVKWKTQSKRTGSKQMKGKSRMENFFLNYGITLITVKRLGLTQLLKCSTLRRKMHSLKNRIFQAL